MRVLLSVGVAAVALLPSTIFAQNTPPPTKPSPSTDAPTTDIVVTAQRLDAARSAIQPSLGATSYTVTNATIQALPGGDNQQFSALVLQLPGVSQDGFGQFHVRDDHGNLQYRINGTILPEGLAVFGQTLSPRLIEKFSLLTGALPAQYGLRTAGIIDVKTKGGLFANEGEVSLYGGSHAMIEPSAEYGGHSGSTNFYGSFDYRRNDLGIESVDASRTPLHDHTEQYQAFGFVDHIIDDHNRLSLLGGYSNQYFQIPDPRGLHPGQGYAIGGQTDYLSDKLNERQIEKTGFGQLALLHDAGPLTVQSSLFVRYSALRYRPDVTGELLFNGQAQAAYKRDLTIGAQVDAAYNLGSANTVRGGFLVTRDRGDSNTTTSVFPVDAMGGQIGQPFVIADVGGQTEWTESVYLQDELKLTKRITLNFGGRFDHYAGYRSEQQFSPRANAVYQTGGTTLHVGYARYFSPPPFELVGTTSIARFAGTSAAPANIVNGTFPNTTPFAERQDYFDIGAQQVIAGGITLGIDAYHRRSRNLIDEGQFGAPIVLTPFNYARGRVDGIEGNIGYNRHGLLVYANFAYAKAKGEQIVSSQFNFDPAALAYIANHFIYLDHDQTYTGSAGFSYKVGGGALKGLKFGADALYGSGLRAAAFGVPNGGKLPAYAQVNLSASYDIGAGFSVRADVINVADHVYEIRDGSGIGVGAPQYGPRRGFFVGVSKKV